MLPGGTASQHHFLRAENMKKVMKCISLFIYGENSATSIFLFDQLNFSLSIIDGEDTESDLVIKVQYFVFGWTFVRVSNLCFLASHEA